MFRAKERLVRLDGEAISVQHRPGDVAVAPDARDEVLYGGEVGLRADVAEDTQAQLLFVRLRDQLTDWSTYKIFNSNNIQWRKKRK